MGDDMLDTLERTRRKDPAMANLGYERDPSDFYPTPEWCTEALLRNYKFDRNYTIWEPACGQGHISRVLEEKGFNVFSSDLNDTGFGLHGLDFLTQQTQHRAIITNPPYKNNLAYIFAKHAIELTEEYQGIVAMFMRTDWGSAATRAPLTQHPAFALKLEMTKRPRWIEDSTGSPRHCFSWYLWDWKTVGQPPRIWFDQ
jgi:hypothetical protein